MNQRSPILNFLGKFLTKEELSKSPREVIELASQKMAIAKQPEPDREPIFSKLWHEILRLLPFGKELAFKQESHILQKYEKKHDKIAQPSTFLRTSYEEALQLSDIKHGRYYQRLQKAANELKMHLSALSADGFRSFIDNNLPKASEIDYSSLKSLPIVKLVVYLNMYPFHEDKEKLLKLVQGTEDIYTFYQEFLLGKDEKLGVKPIKNRI